MSGAIATSRSGRARGLGHDERVGMGAGAIAVPPRAMEGPAREGRRIGVQAREAVPLGGVDRVEGDALGEERRGGSSRGRFGRGPSRAGSAGPADSAAGSAQSGSAWRVGVTRREYHRSPELLACATSRHASRHAQAGRRGGPARRYWRDQRRSAICRKPEGARDGRSRSDPALAARLARSPAPRGSAAATGER